MTIDELETELLRLPPGERARLAERLIRSLDEVSQEEAERLWDEEARRRDEELDRDPVVARSADDVLRRIRASIT